MPTVSIILPTYNRSDVLDRAVESVRRQTFEDWELIVVDDGSTDETETLFDSGDPRIDTDDPRIQYVRQKNRGVYAARNNGLERARGRYITFLDSDDEWLPHYLELTSSFLDAEPREQYVSTELWVDYGGGRRARLHRDAVKVFVAHAKYVGPDSLTLPPGEEDNYMRIYETREPLGSWGREIAERAGYPGASLYRGRIFRHYRWGYLGWLPTTMLRREALDRIGTFNEDFRTTDDYRFLGLLSREFRANMIAIPSATKHQIGVGGKALEEDHLATGSRGHTFATNRLRLFDEVFGPSDQFDGETQRIRALHEEFAGRQALLLGRRREAIDHFSAAWRNNRALISSAWLGFGTRLVPSAALSAKLYRLSRRLTWRWSAAGKLTRPGRA